jgi:hypothetical protein
MTLDEPAAGGAFAAAASTDTEVSGGGGCLRVDSDRTRGDRAAVRHTQHAALLDPLGRIGVR